MNASEASYFIHGFAAGERSSVVYDSGDENTKITVGRRVFIRHDIPWTDFLITIAKSLAEEYEKGRNASCE